VSIIDSTIWWQVFPLGACGAPIRDREADDSGHRLLALEPWLDYLIGLGCNGLLLGPIFESVSHGYDTLDHFRIDRRLGNDADFDHLMEACAIRGIRVMLDGVFNHVAASHPRAAELGARDAAGKLVSWEGHDELVTLDHSKPEVVDLVVDVMLTWLRAGITGWRLDVAYAVPTEFWRTVAARVRSDFPDTVFLGEVIHGDYASFVEESTLDTVTQYELWKAIWSSLKEANMWELAWSLDRHSIFQKTFVPQTFIGNHDVERIASQIGEKRAALAAAILMTVPGMPSVYYGDEQAFRGRKLEGFRADDELRPPLPRTPKDLFSGGEAMHRFYQRLIALRRQHPWLTRASLEVVGKENEWIEYAVHGRRGEHLDVRIEVAPVERLHIVGAGTDFRWS
jgi:glycosidase